jgi:peptidylprolyl isomerase
VEPDPSDPSATAEPPGDEGATPADGLEASPDASPSPEPSPYIDPPSSTQVQLQGEAPAGGEVIDVGSLAAVNWAIWTWGEPTAVSDTFSGTPMVFPVTTDNPTLIALARTVVGQKVGSRVMGVIPPADGALAGALGVDEGATLVIVADILERFSADIQAQADAKPTGAILPVTVTGELGGEAKVSVPGDADEPTEISTTVIARGTGEEVKDGWVVLIHYAAVDWSGRADGSTWQAGHGPEAVEVVTDPSGNGSTLKAFSGLAGIPIGSRVLVLTPGKKGAYLADAVVIDIVGVVKASTEEPAEEDPEDSASPSPTPAE